MLKVKINGTVFTIDDQIPILQSVIDQGFSVSHSCRSGRCSDCLAVLENNGVTDKILSCQYIPKSGDNFTFARFEKVQLPRRQIYPAKIEELILLSEKYMLVKLKLPRGKKLNFLPGQYINVIKNGVGQRSYSIASSKEAMSISLIIQKVPGGQLSNFWFQRAKVGELLQIHGPFGSFYMRPNYLNSNMNTIFAATGSGIAPLLSMLSSHRDVISNNFYGLWSMKYYDDFFIQDFFDNTTTDKIWQKYLTKENKKGFKSGRIVKPIMSLIEHILSKSDKKIDVYACGNSDFINLLKNQIGEIDSMQVGFYADAFHESGVE